MDIVIFRENTEGLYVGKEEQIDENTVHAIKIVTKKASERIIRDAFEYAKKNGRKKLPAFTRQTSSRCLTACSSRSSVKLQRITRKLS